MKDLATHCFGIKQTELIVAQMLDVDGVDVEKCLQKVEKKITKLKMEDTNYTYILECSDGSLYCGWTNDLEKRVKAHNEGKGAKYTKTRTPVQLVYYEIFDSKEEAMSREWHIKQMTRKEKEALIQK